MLLINLFGGPGIGKSTIALGVTFELKQRRLRAEYVPEYAKDLVYEGASLSDQLAIFGEQQRRIRRLADAGIDFAVTDSPLLLQLVYATNVPNTFTALVHEVHNTYNTLNILLRRHIPYEPFGRLQSEGEAHIIDTTIETNLKAAQIPYHEIQSLSSAIPEILALCSPDTHCCYTLTT